MSVVSLSGTRNASNITTGTLPVARGGTGTTSSTGTGNNVLSDEPTLTGTVTAATIAATKIGIGTSTPSVPLQITSSATQSFAADRTIYFNEWNTTLNEIVSQTAVYGTSIATEGWINSFAGFGAISDERAKEDIQDLPPHRALEIARRIRPKTFRFVDRARRGNTVNHGFIAQAIERELPASVSRMEDFVPNIYARASVRGAQLMLPQSAAPKVLDVREHPRIRVFFEHEGEPRELTVVSASSNVLTLDGPLEQGVERVFVYGQKVSDHRSVKVDEILAVTLGALHDLDRQLLEVRADLAALKAAATAGAGA